MKPVRYKQRGQTGLFDREETPSKLSKPGNPLEKLHKVIDFEMFRPLLESTMLNRNKKNNAGCKPYGAVMMFKIILLKRFYSLSDEQAEYQIIDRLSFREFSGLSSGDRVPDARTIWLFQDNLIGKNLEENLFEIFHTLLDERGLFVNGGKIIDAKSKLIDTYEVTTAEVHDGQPNDFYIRSIGFVRAKGIIGLINLLYSMCRYEQIVRLNILPIKS
jgi:transposase